ncbi:hypothetical protein HMPREF9370_1139 [Neisseria wadsworthii 9715]|uniref:Uncharacterized protein n=1 Tax=Neisseria wadsworthii 9715 TaxID=1030841 RepID=G4CPX9_9NEIS|nr:hypothetical protein HMPREF9370_1139 [Neisseria wadsworthii 9715]
MVIKLKAGREETPLFRQAFLIIPTTYRYTRVWLSMTSVLQINFISTTVLLPLA